ncbi:FAD-dependent oxidoreductase, partial [Arthrospira platensis SPKY1]|nr:FAD-dependent oxidoreductase [Arthrospira platensis SPKY1]
TLIYSAEVLHLARHGKLFGLLGGEQMTVDWPALHRRKCAMVDDFKSYRQEQLQSDRFTLIRERAQFVAPDTLELSSSGRRLQSARILIATGSKVAQPDIAGLDHPAIWTSDDVLNVAEDPGSVIVLGGGVVACELT